jgi:hypothetical protein
MCSQGDAFCMRGVACPARGKCSRKTGTCRLAALGDGGAKDSSGVVARADERAGYPSQRPAMADMPQQNLIP